MARDGSNQAAPSGGPLSSVEAWDLVADAYTIDVVPWAQDLAREALKIASLPQSAHIVDVATGPGTLALVAAREGAMVSAIDFSPAMLANLRHRAETLGLTLADVRVADGQALPFDDESFDGAFSLAGLVFFPDRGAGFSEMWRVLSEGRRAVVSSTATIEGPSAHLLEGIRAMLPDLPFGEGKAPLSDPAEFSHEMSAAGFQEVAIHTLKHSVVTPSLSEYWRKAQRSTAPIVLLRRRLGKERWANVANGVFHRLQEAVGDGPVEDVYTVHMGVGVK